MKIFKAGSLWHYELNVDWTASFNWNLGYKNNGNDNANNQRNPKKSIRQSPVFNGSDT